MINFNLDKKALNMMVEENVREALKITGAGLVKIVKDSMQPGSGRVYKVKGQEHIASSPGQPPAPWSGRLRDSITYHTNFGDKSELGPAAKATDAIGKPKRAMGGYAVSVGSNTPYALTMERGQKIKKVAARPYLWPALKRSRNLIKEAFDRV